MSLKLRQTVSILEYISTIRDKKLRQANLRYVSKDPRFYSTLREIAYNAVRGNIKVPKHVVNKLNKYKRVLRGLVKKEKSKLKQRKLVEQSGGFLPYLIPIVSTLLSTLT
jgi:predicted nucleotidyltransferase